ncbi:MAG TPA: hypothetical protein VFQ88_00745 [Nevskiaceae bacterium]|nr:hypothetical protein [Nevskiaceae bacterium]
MNAAPTPPPRPPAGQEPRGHNRSQLLLVFIVTAIPLALAWFFFETPTLRQHLSSHRTNHGQLVTPPKVLPSFKLIDLDHKPIPETAFKHHWSLIFIGGSTCDEACVLQVFQVHNVRWLLQSQYKRLRVFYLAPDAAAIIAARDALVAKPVLLKKSFGLPVMVNDAPDAKNATGFFGEPSGSLLMVDPKGRWIQTYPPGYHIKGVYQDLRRLLRFSQLG